MADKKISELDPAATLAPTDVVALAQPGMTRKASLSQLGIGGPPVVPAASGVTFTPTGSIAATDVQGALGELDTEKEAAGTAAALIAGNRTNLLNLSLFGGPAMQTTAPYLLLTPGTTIAAVTKFYTVPAGYMAVMSNFQIFTGPTGPVTTSIFVMPDSVTTPTATDRMYNFLATGANTTTNALMSVIMDEGSSMWAFASVNNEVMLFPQVTLIKKPQVGGLYTNIFQKQMASGTDQLLYTAGTGWAIGVGTGVISNTTVAAMFVTIKIKRASDGATFTLVKTSATANTHTAFQSGQCTLSPGDKLYVNAAAPGANLCFVLIERPVV